MGKENFHPPTLGASANETTIVLEGWERKISIQPLRVALANETTIVLEGWEKGNFHPPTPGA